MDSKRPLIILSGPTAVGKTSLSVRFAMREGLDIISADSAQVYRGMDIGTAKITEEEKKGIPHYLIDVCDPSEDYSAFRFKEMAEQAIVVEVDLRRLGETFADARVIRLETEDNVARIEDGEPQVDGRPRNP